MTTLGIDDLYRDADDWDRLTDLTPGIDPWCTGTDWMLPLFATWGRPPAVVFHRPGVGRAAFGWVDLPEGRALVGLDSVWGFASCMVGPDPQRLVEWVADELDDIAHWDAVFLTGLFIGGPLDQAAVPAFGRRHRLFAGPESPRCVADLSEGAAPWWARRSERFRRNVRRARAAACAAGVSFNVLDDMDPDAVMDRILAAEARSWKGREGSGLAEPHMGAAYRGIARRLGAAGRLRVCMAMLDGVDIGYVLGGVRSGTYRGLQISYSAEHPHLSIGHLLQDHELHRVAAEGVRRYDLGMDLEYKRRWADAVEVSRTIVAVR